MKKSIIQAVTFLLVLLWAYAISSKLLDFEDFQRQMGNRVFGKSTSVLLVLLVPLSELIAIILLIISKTRIYGFLFSAFLLLLFSIYIVLVLNSSFDRTPCSCGGMLEKMSWGQQLAFNIFFILITSVAIILMQQHAAFAERTFINKKGGIRQT